MKYENQAHKIAFVNVIMQESLKLSQLFFTVQYWIMIPGKRVCGQPGTIYSGCKILYDIRPTYLRFMKLSKVAQGSGDFDGHSRNVNSVLIPINIR